MSDSRLRIPSHVAYQQLVRETVVFNLRTGAYKSFRRDAGRLLALIERHGSMEEAATEIARETGRPLDSVRRSVAAHCVDLARSGLLEIERRAA
jgi:hypothetical protein